MDKFAVEIKEKALTLGVSVTDLLLIHIIDQLANIAEAQIEIVKLASQPPLFMMPEPDQSPLVKAWPR